MKLPKSLWTVVAAIVVTMTALTINGATPTTALAPTVIYDSTVSPLPGNLPSVGAQAYQFNELGDAVTFASTERNLNSVKVTLSSWGCQSGAWNTADCVTTPGATFAIPITFNIYNPGSPTPGALIATRTQTFNVPYRPSASVNCTGTNAGKWYSTSDSLCFNGLANNITFDFSSPNVVLPNSVVYGIAYNTSGYGPAPLGYATVCASAPGGCFYDSLNIALAPAVVVGSKPFAATLYQNTGYSSNYCDNGSGGTGTFRLDSPTSACWTGYIPAVQFTPTVAPPTNVSQCKKDGWKTFNNPSFQNQGDCVSYVEHLS